MMFDAHGSGQATAPTSDPVGYKGEFGYYRDVETGLLLLTHRYLDVAAGRFVIRDPISYPGGVNLFGYCWNNPVHFVDVEGTHAKPGKTPPGRWPRLPENLAGKKPKWNPEGYWKGKPQPCNPSGEYSWDDRAHGTGQDRGQGEQGGHWDGRDGGRWNENGEPLPYSGAPGPWNDYARPLREDWTPFIPFIPGPKVFPRLSLPPVRLPPIKLPPIRLPSPFPRPKPAPAR
jgi:RHS repeat-associated protein